MYDPDWGASIRKLRCDRGFNQAQVARAVGVSQMTISRWELGQGRPCPRRKNVIDTIRKMKGGIQLVYPAEEGERRG